MTIAAGFGAKLTARSIRRTSSGLVEMMNARWAKLANEMAAEAGVVADYDDRSYERLEIEAHPAAAAISKSGGVDQKGVFPLTATKICARRFTGGAVRVGDRVAREIVKNLSPGSAFAASRWVGA